MDEGRGYFLIEWKIFKGLMVVMILIYCLLFLFLGIGFVVKDI